MIVSFARKSIPRNMSPRRVGPIQGLPITMLALLLQLDLAVFKSTSWGEEPLDETPIVNTQVDKTEITIGEKISYKITVVADPLLEIKLPEFGVNLGAFTIKDFGRAKPKLRKGNSVLAQWYLLDIYTTGTYTIPSPVIRYTESTGAMHEIGGQEIQIEVKSVLSEANPGDIKDITAPTNIPFSYQTLILWLVFVALLLTIAIIIFIYFRRRKMAEREPVRRSAHEIAYEQLEALNASQLIEREQIEEYYVVISNTIRSYLENQFELKAPEMTTEEFLEVAARESNLKNEHKTLLSKFLINCDLVKFARHGPDNAEMKSAYDAAKQFVDETASFLIDEDL